MPGQFVVKRRGVVAEVGTYLHIMEAKRMAVVKKI